MKLKLAYALAALAMASNSNAAIFAVSNVVNGYGYSDALFQNIDNSLLDGGIVALGHFGGNTFNEADMATSITNFTVLGSALAGSNSTLLGGGFAGYVDTVVNGAIIGDGNALVGEPLFLFVGNAATLAASTHFALVQTAVIQSDNPLEQTYGADVFGLLGSPAVLMGTTGSFTGTIPTDLNSGAEDTFSTLKLAAPVPEPSAAILGGLGALIACVRRRRI